jgi:osmoprotectant transport system ATP-binding protein
MSRIAPTRLGAHSTRVPIPLSARNVSHRYDSALVLDGVSVDVPAGATVALVGQSGSGKTTLLRCFNRLVEPASGDIRLDGTDVRDLDPITLRRRLGYVQQRGGLLPHWTAAENIGLVLRANGRSAEERGAAVASALALVGLEPERFAACYPNELSGGQQQRVALARALAARPEAILLDEPFGALDAITRAEMQDAFRDIRKELGITTLLVTHDLAEAARLADRVVVMREGRVEQEGTFAELKSAPATEYVQALIARAISAAQELVS